MEKKEKRKSASKWDQGSERALLEVWAERMVELRGVRKNSHIILEMVAKLERQGYKYTVPELKTKMHNITARYRKEKQKIGTTGGSPSDWDLYKEVETLLACSKTYNPEGLVVDSVNNINTSISAQILIQDVSPLPTPPSPSPSPLPSSPLPTSSPTVAPSPLSINTPSSTAATKKKNNFEKFFKNVERNIEKIEEEIKKTSERVIKIEEEKKNILKSYVDREADVQKALIDFLKRS